MTWGYLVYGSAIGFNAPAIHSLMQGNATDLYGDNITLTFQQASWMCKFSFKTYFNIPRILSHIILLIIHKWLRNVFLLFSAGILSLGSFFGYLIFVSLMGSFGRKVLVWCTTACYLMGHMAVFFASNAIHLLYFAR